MGSISCDFCVLKLCIYKNKGRIADKVITSSHLSSTDFSHLSSYHIVAFVKPLKHNHEALHIAQADIAALILLWNEYAIINAIEVA